MSQVDDILTAIKAAAFDTSVSELSRRSGVSEDSVRRLLKRPPLAVENLRRLEAAADDIRRAKEAERQAKT